MSSTKTEICNMALMHLGSSKTISNVDTEQSAEAKACRIFYDTLLDATQRDFPFTFCTRILSLGLVDTDPNDEWLFSYRYPSSCLKFLRVLSGLRNDTRQTKVPTKIASDDSGKLIYTDVEDAVGEYRIRITDTSLWTPDYVLAFSLRLGVYIAPKITGADPFKRQDAIMKLYQFEMGLAEASDANEGQDEEAPDSELINSRS